MKPFFSYYGSKYRLSARGFYPAPSGDVVIEPFAGSACYSVYHNVKHAILIDKNETICTLWSFLITANKSDIEILPSTLERGFDIADYINKKSLHPGAGALIGFWVGKALHKPAKTPYNWFFKYQNSGRLMWGERVKNRIIAQLPMIKNWQVICDDYSSAPNITNATYFIDPPYSSAAGRKYPNNKLDYQTLADWTQNRQGQTIACEDSNLTKKWADFSHATKGTSANVLLSSRRELCAIR